MLVEKNVQNVTFLLELFFNYFRKKVPSQMFD